MTVTLEKHTPSMTAIEQAEEAGRKLRFMLLPSGKDFYKTGSYVARLDKVMSDTIIRPHELSFLADIPSEETAYGEYSLNDGWTVDLRDQIKWYGSPLHWHYYKVGDTTAR